MLLIGLQKYPMHIFFSQIATISCLLIQLLLVWLNENSKTQTVCCKECYPLLYTFRSNYTSNILKVLRGKGKRKLVYNFLNHFLIIFIDRFYFGNFKFIRKRYFAIMIGQNFVLVEQ